MILVPYNLFIFVGVFIVAYLIGKPKSFSQKVSVPF